MSSMPMPMVFVAVLVAVLFAPTEQASLVGEDRR